MRLAVHGVDVRRRMAPVPLTDGEADPEHVRRAKDFLRNVAREAGLEIVGEDEILGEP